MKIVTKVMEYVNKRIEDEKWLKENAKRREARKAREECYNQLLADRAKRLSEENVKRIRAEIKFEMDKKYNQAK